MAKTIGDLVAATGLTRRAIRHFETIGILKPERLNNGYRIYSDRQLDRLFSALVFRELGMPLKDVAQALDTADKYSLLVKQLELLQEKQKRVEIQIDLIQKMLKGDKINMNQKFESFKEKSLRENDEMYGDEVIERWGEDHYKASQEKISKLSDEEFQAVLNEGKEILVGIGQDMDKALPQTAKEVQEKVADYYNYLKNFGDFYTLDIYANLAQMYVQDDRFAKYFNDIHEGIAHYFSAAIEHFCIVQSL